MLTSTPGPSLFPVLGLLVSAGLSAGTVPQAREIFRLDFAGQTAVAGLPAGAHLLYGRLEVALKDGAPMLKASAPTEFLLTLPEALPDAFTLEFDLVPRAGGSSEDLAFEGTATLSESSSSAHVFWGVVAQRVSGGGPVYQSTTPGDIADASRSQLTRIVASFEGETFKLYTNGKRLYTLTERRFARGRVLRVFLGGQDEGDQAVYLAGLRITAGAVTIAQTQSGQLIERVTESGAGSIRAAGGKVAVVEQPTTPTVTSPASSGAVADKPVSTTRSAIQNPLDPRSPTSPPPAPPTPPPAPPPDPSPPAPALPIGAGEAMEGEILVEPEPPAELEPPQDPIVPSVMVLDGVAFRVMLRKGGSGSGQVVEIPMADGTIKKHLGTMSFEPLVVDVTPGSPLDKWFQQQVTGGLIRKSGSLSGGTIPQGQELRFRDAILTSLVVPALVAPSTAAGFLRYTLLPEEIISSTSTLSVSPVSQSSWSLSGFRMTMGDIETMQVVRIEPITAAFELSANNTGEQRIATTTLSKRTVSNLRLTLSLPDTETAPRLLAWYEEFVIKGYNGDDREKNFTLELLGSDAKATLAQLRGDGVGIIAVRALPNTGTSRVRQLQVDLYVERLSIP